MNLRYKEVGSQKQVETHSFYLEQILTDGGKYIPAAIVQHILVYFQASTNKEAIC